jgi:hypothetical protein
VLLGDVDLHRWKQDLIEDRNRLATLLAAARSHAARDAKLAKLRDMIAHKCRTRSTPATARSSSSPPSPTPRTTSTRNSPLGQGQLGIETALVTGSGPATRPPCPACARLSSILTAFSPRSKERPAELAHEGEIDLLIATDCISEGQNLQDCDWLVNYDIHWNPVRIIQRFGRIDRIGSPNERIQLVNFWPNMELEEYINLEQRVSGRMVLLDISATGEENLIEQQSGNPMNDLEYRRKQLLKLQDTVIDMEDLSSGVSITDLTLTDFRIDLAEYLKAHPGKLEGLPLGAYAVTTSIDADIPPGVIFCLRAEGALRQKSHRIRLPAGTALPGACRRRRRRAAALHPGQAHPRPAQAPGAGARPARRRRLRPLRQAPPSMGEDMRHAQKLLGRRVASVVGKNEERAVASLFSPGRHARHEGRVRRQQ